MTAVVITEPGLVFDMPAADYHTSISEDGPILSATRAKTLLQSGGPAKYRHQQANPVQKKAYDEGNAAHAFALGKDAERLVIIDADSYRTAKAQDLRDAAYANGKTPLIPKQVKVAQDMANELRRHPLAMESLQGQAEVSMFYRHDSGVWLRSRLDVMADGFSADYKTTKDASTAGFEREAFGYGYHMQAGWYRRMRHWLTGDLLPYRIVAQEKTAPYLISVWELDTEYLGMGEQQMDEAIAIYRECTEADDWPGYPAELQQLTPPDWAVPEMEFEQEEEA